MEKPKALLIISISTDYDSLFMLSSQDHARPWLRLSRLMGASFFNWCVCVYVSKRDNCDLVIWPQWETFFSNHNLFQVSLSTWSLWSPRGSLSRAKGIWAEMCCTRAICMTLLLMWCELVWHLRDAKHHRINWPNWHGCETMDAWFFLLCCRVLLPIHVSFV